MPCRTAVSYFGVLVASAVQVGAGTGAPPGPAGHDETEVNQLAQVYEQQVRPILEQYCFKCHGAKRAEAEIDLESVRTPEAVRRHTRAWQKVDEMLATDQMPPRESKQPAAEQKRQVRDWLRSYLVAEARSRDGDPGPIVMRRLTNAEYTYTVRDLTGVQALDPAREFPEDSAAGEGFTNAAGAMVMSPSLLTKYFDAAKELAQHAVLVPDGFRFSPHVTRRDHTEEMLAQIRNFYGRFVDGRGGDRVNLQGIVFDTNQGGRLPLDKYLEATLVERESLERGVKEIASVAAEQELNAKYLATLWESLTAGPGNEAGSMLLDRIRARWRASKPGDGGAIAEEIGRWQQTLWKFSSVGHIGKVGGPSAWMEPSNPIKSRHEIRLKLPAPDSKQDEIRLYLAASDLADGNASDYLIWERPRLVTPGQPDLMLRDLRSVARDLELRRDRIVAQTAGCLAAAAEAATQERVDIPALAEKHSVEPDSLAAWLVFLGFDAATPATIDSYLTNKLEKIAGYDFVRGWGSPDTPNIVANSADQHVRIPGNARPHGVAVHPSPKLGVVIGWRSPATGPIAVSGSVEHAHPECGNGVTWSLELRRGTSRQRLAAGVAQGSKSVPVGPVPSIAVRAGDLITIAVGARDGNHGCDLTAIDLELSGADRSWNLARDIAPDVLAGNPHADSFGNDAVWHFFSEPDRGDTAWAIPAGSLVARWQSAPDDQERRGLAEQIQQLISGQAKPEEKSADAALVRQLTSLGGPLIRAKRPESVPTPDPAPPDPNRPAWGLDPTAFGKHPSGQPIDAESFCVQAPALIELRLPADLAESTEFVATGTLDPETGSEGSVQIQILTEKPDAEPAIRPSPATTEAKGTWTNNRQVIHSIPVLVQDGSEARRRIEKEFDSFRGLFPAALCYTKIVPVDEVVTLTLMYREDGELRRLMLDDKQAAELDRLWEELHYISRDALTLVDAFEQLWQYATQDADPKVFEPLRQPIYDRAAAFRQRLIDSEPAHIDALIRFANRVYRRPLTESELTDIRSLYDQLRQQDISHDDAFRLTLARLLVSPSFLYRIEQPGDGSGQAPVSNWELASRLSYFLWSTLPDDELWELAGTGRLVDCDLLAQQSRRMLADPRIRRLATEFACQWLQIYKFDSMDEKSERHFPSFAALREPMYEESIRFITELIRNDRSIMELLDSDYAVVNEVMASHYGIPDVAGSEWRVVQGVRQFHRGGLLAHATVLSKQAGASRTSPILRGNWISEVLLGERLPRPPKDVPQLPETAPPGLTERQLIERHSSHPACSRCHVRIDPLGFALEQFDAIGRYRVMDDGNGVIDTKTVLVDGTPLDGFGSLRDYLATARRDDFVRQFCRKLLGYALGRSIQLSDEPLLERMQERLRENDYRFSAAVQTILQSRQFGEIRGRDTVTEEDRSEP